MTGLRYAPHYRLSGCKSKGSKALKETAFKNSGTRLEPGSLRHCQQLPCLNPRFRIRLALTRKLSVRHDAPDLLLPCKAPVSGLSYNDSPLLVLIFLRLR